MSVFRIPRQVDEHSAIRLILDIEREDADDKLVLDFGDMQFARPFGTLLLAEEIKRIVKERKEIGKRVVSVNHDLGYGAHSYLSHVGFFKYIGLDYGSAPGSAPGGSTYVPIEVIDINKLRQIYGADKPIGKLVEFESLRIARVLLGHPTLVGDHPVPYSFREVIRNVFEHGNTSQCVIAAQKYVGKEIEIAILDKGIGLRQSLAAKFDVPNDRQAIELALQPGVSGSEIEERASSYWENSGYGLYVLSEFARRTGDFLICSGDSAIKYMADVREFLNFRFTGTAIKLRIVKNPGLDLVALRKEIIEEGEKGALHGRRASGSSKGS